MKLTLSHCLYSMNVSRANFGSSARTERFRTGVQSRRIGQSVRPVNGLLASHVCPNVDRDEVSDILIDLRARQRLVLKSSGAFTALPGLFQNMNGVLSSLFGVLAVLEDELDAACRIVGGPIDQMFQRAQSSRTPGPATAPSAQKDAPKTSAAPPASKPNATKSTAAAKAAAASAPAQPSPPPPQQQRMMGAAPQLQVPLHFNAATHITFGAVAVYAGFMFTRITLRRQRKQKKEAAAIENAARAERLKAQKFRMQAALASNRVADRRLEKAEADALLASMDEQDEAVEGGPGMAPELDEQALKEYKKFLGGAKLPSRERIWSVEELTKGRFER